MIGFPDCGWKDEHWEAFIYGFRAVVEMCFGD